MSKLAAALEQSIQNKYRRKQITITLPEETVDKLEEVRNVLEGRFNAKVSSTDVLSHMVIDYVDELYHHYTSVPVPPPPQV